MHRITEAAERGADSAITRVTLLLPYKAHFEQLASRLHFSYLRQHCREIELIEPWSLGER